MTGVPVRTVFLGSGAFGLPALRALAGHSAVTLVGVVSAPARAAGRHGEQTPTPIANAAGELGLEPLLTPERLRDPAAIASVLALEPGLAVLADYGQIVPPPLLDLPHGALNLHPSLLPRHRGATPIPAAILAGDQSTGVTLMRMDAGLDTGPIVGQVVHPLEGGETAPALEAALAHEAAALLVGALDGWLAGERLAIPQTEAGATLTRPLRRTDGRLEPARAAIELERQVRAYQPWPGTFVETDAGRLVVLAARVGAGVADVAPGTFTDLGLVVGDRTILELRDVQPAGGRPMRWDAFVRGRPAIVGSRARG